MGQLSSGVGPVREQGQRRAPIFTRDFVLVCLTAFGCFMTMQFLNPTLPLYVKGLGGTDFDIGLVLGIYSISALIFRFVAGALLDQWGRRQPLIIGVLLYLAGMLLYGITTTVPSLVLLRLFTGVGFGIVSTACSALAADLAPPDRRGEAMGYYGTVSSIAMAVGPAIALWLITLTGLPLSGFPLLFVFCDAAVVLQLLFALQIGETRRPDPKTATSGRRLSVTSTFSREAVPVALAMLFGAFTAGAILSFASIYLSTENTQNVPIFFLAYSAVMVVSRPLVGVIADHVDRRLVAIPMMFLCAVGVSIFAFSPTLPVALASALIFGIGYGSVNSILMALVVDVVNPQERGAAMGTFMAAVDLGIGGGSMILGVVAQAYGYRSVFLVAGAVGLIGLVYFIVFQRLSARQRAVKQPRPAVDSLSVD